MKIIYVVGLGPGGLDLVPGRNMELITQKKPVFVRTKKHPAAEELAKQGLGVISFDDLYLQYETFEEVYKAIVDKLLESLTLYEEIVYAVPGHPFVAETTVELLKKEAEKGGITVIPVPAMSCLDAIYASLGLDPTKGLVIKDALSINAQDILPGTGLIITQLYNRQVASEVKLTLMEVYPAEHQITLIQGAGKPDLERIEVLPLFKLDRVNWIDHLTSLYVEPYNKKLAIGKYPLEPLVQVMQDLLGENGCPWDKEQTHESLKKYLIEECYEVIEAIEEENMYKLCDELGDLLLQIVFHTELASQAGSFNLEDVVAGITEKMIRRHPHVFGQVKVENTAEVLYNWEEIKKEEKKKEGQKIKLEVPRGLPALQRAQKIQNKVAKLGFDWQDIEGPWEKLNEEIQELKEAICQNKFSSIKEELGDLLFSIVNVARFLKVEAEDALAFTNNKFIKRFRFMEKEATRKGCEIGALTVEEMDRFWERSKKM